MTASATADRDTKSFATGRVLLAVLASLLAGICRSVYSQNCTSNGALRLVGGSTAREGTVEICLDSTWGTVCDDFWGNMSAQVVCRQLGYPASGAVAYRDAYFGNGSGSVHIGSVRCNGTEQRIVDCHLNYGNGCVHSEDAGVNCTAPCTPEGGVRLTGDDRPGSGTVWVCINGTWSTVCDNYWNIPDARVVCRQLEYNDGQGAQAYASAFYGEGFGPILLDYVQCGGNEAALLDCTHMDHSQCDHSSDAGVACYIGSSSVYTSPSILLVSSSLMSTSLWASLSSNITTALITASTQVITTLSSPTLTSLTSTKQTPTSSIAVTTQLSPSTLLVSSYQMSTSLWASLSSNITTALTTNSTQVITTLSSPSLTSLTSAKQTPISSLAVTTQLSKSTAFSTTPTATPSISITQTTPTATTSTPITQTTPTVQSSHSSSVISQLQSKTSSLNVTVTLSTSLTDSRSRSASMTTSLLTPSHTLSLTGTPSQSKSVATSREVLSTPASLSTTPLQTPLDTLSQSPTSIESSSRDLTFATTIPTRSSFTPLSLSSFSSASSTPSGGGNAGLTLPAVVSISIAAATIVIAFIFLIIVIPCTYRICKKIRKTDQTEYDLTSDTNPLTSTQYGADTVHLDIQSQDGDSVSYEDASPPTTELADVLEVGKERGLTEPVQLVSHKQPAPQTGSVLNKDAPSTPEIALKLELRPRHMETGSPQLLSHKESHSSVDQRQDPDRSSSSTVSEAPETPDTEGVTGLQDKSDDTSVAEEVEMKELGDDEEVHSSDRLQIKSSGEHSDTGKEVELNEMHSLESREHKPSQKYQKL